MKRYPSAEVSERTKIVDLGANYVGSQTLITVPELVLGEGCQINAGTRIVGEEKVTVGKHVVVGYNCVILSGSDTVAERMDDSSERGRREVVCAPVKIGDYAYVASLCLLMPGVEVGEGAVVEAYSYVPAFTKLEAWHIYRGKKKVGKRPRPILNSGLRRDIAPPKQSPYNE